MQCTQCHAQLEENAKFCTNCGVMVNDENTSETIAANTTELVESNNNSSSQTNDYVEQGKVISKHYWNFIRRALATPYLTSKEVTQQDRINGIITLVLFSILLPLFTYSSIRSLSDGYIVPPFFDVVIKPVFGLILFSALLTLVKFGVAKLMKAHIDFFGVLTTYGTLMVLPTVVAFASLLLSFFSSYGFSMMLFILAISLTSVASMATIFAIKTKAPEKSGLDVIYGLLITYLAIAIILLVIGDSVLGSLLNELENMFYTPPF